MIEKKNQNQIYAITFLVKQTIYLTLKSSLNNHSVCYINLKLTNNEKNH